MDNQIDSYCAFKLSLACCTKAAVLEKKEWVGVGGGGEEGGWKVRVSAAGRAIEVCVQAPRSTATLNSFTL